jgi:hypothetical protein
MTNVIVQIMVEVLTILAIMTKEAKRGLLSESMPYISTFLTDRLFREVFQEVDGKQRHRGQSGQVGQVDARRGTDGICGAAEDDT